MKMKIELDKNQKSILVVLLVILFASPFTALGPWQFVTKKEKAMLYSNTAMADLQRKDLVSAEKNFRKAVSLDSQNVVYQESIGTVLSVQPEKINEATDVFNKILKEYPSNMTALYYLGSYAQGKSDYEEAKKKLQAYIDVNPQNPEVLTMLGVVYYKTGNKEGAKEQWQKALAIDPNFEAAKGNLMAVDGEAK